jgi:hypothetical protein
MVWETVMAFRGVAVVAAVMMEEAVMVVMTSLLLIPIFVTTFGMATPLVSQTGRHIAKNDYTNVL